MFVFLPKFKFKIALTIANMTVLIGCINWPFGKYIVHDNFWVPLNEHLQKSKMNE
jgi:hypothetical protein